MGESSTIDEGRYKFDRPPVVETVISLQFKPLENLSSPLVGLFWEQLGRTEWPYVKHNIAVEDATEQFGLKQPLQRPQIKLAEVKGPERIQLIRKDRHRMIQVQPNRFIHNWLKHGEGDTGYPSYRTLKPEFDEAFKEFSQFVDKNNLGEIQPNQWEVTYVNHIPSGEGELWETTEDWISIFEGLGHLCPSVSGDLPMTIDRLAVGWAMEIGNAQGRIHALIKSARRQEDDSNMLVLNLTTRGPIDEDRSSDEGLEIGHRAIVETFVNSTSKKAHNFWGRQK